MSKKYEDVKRAAEANIRGLCRAIRNNLDTKEVNHLFMELSMTLFTASLDFNLPLDVFISDLSDKQSRFLVSTSDAVSKLKFQIDNGEDYDAEDL